MKLAGHADGWLQLHLDHARHTNAGVHNHFASRAGNKVKPSTTQATSLEGATIQWHADAYLTTAEFVMANRKLHCFAN